MRDPLKRVLEEWGIDPAEYPEDDDDTAFGPDECDDLPDFGGPEEDDDGEWEEEFDDDDPYLDA